MIDISFLMQWNLIPIILVLFFTLIISSIFRRWMQKHIDISTKFLKIDATSYRFFKNSITGLIYVIGIGLVIYLVPSLRSLAVSVFAGAGILAIIIGFASQQAFSNIVSGIFIVIFKPFRVGDWIKTQGNIYGVVEDINLRHTTVKDFENKRYIIPNNIISNETIENLSIGDERIRKHVEFGISYDSDVDKAIKIIRSEVKKHPLWTDQRTKKEKDSGEEEVPIKVISLGDFSVNIRSYVWVKNPSDSWIIYTDLLKNVKKRFDNECIEIPFPYRTIVMKDNKKKTK